MSIQNIEEQILKSIEGRNRMSDIIYKGDVGDEDGVPIEQVNVLRGTDIKPLPHSGERDPTGFSWGYGGSGPAELSRSILADFFGKQSRQVALYHDFKWNVIAGLKKGQSFQLTDSDITSWWKDLLRRNPDLAREMEKAEEKTSEGS